jgi:hypothetical protein
MPRNGLRAVEKGAGKTAQDNESAISAGSDRL